MKNTFQNFVFTPPLHVIFLALKGNIFDPSSLMGYKAIHYESNPSLAALDQYRVGAFGQNQGGSLYPYFISSFQFWFNKMEDGDYTCPPGASDPDDPDKASKLNAAANTQINLLEGGIGEAYGEEIEFDTKLKLFRSLNALQELATLSESQEYWYNQLENTTVGAFIGIEEQMNVITAFTETEATQVSGFITDINQLQDEIAAIEWFEIDETATNFTIDEVQKALRDTKIAVLKTKTQSLAAIINSKNAGLLTALPQLNTSNNAINTAGSVAAQNLKAVNGIMFQRLAAGFSDYSETDWQTLNNIANQCVGEGGEGVYTARALVAEVTKSLTTYDDECVVSQNQPRISLPVGNTKSRWGLTLQPNPVQDIAIVDLPTEYSFSELHLFNLLGEKVLSVSTSEKMDFIKLDVSHLNTGVYFITPGDKSSESLKLIISR